MNHSLSVILPCYNPQVHPDWADLVITNMTRINTDFGISELVLVNDGSRADLSNELAFIGSSLPFVKIVSYTTNMGKGYAIRKGIEAATGELIIYTDIDFPYTYDSFKKIYTVLQDSSSKIAIGVKNDIYYASVPFVRKNISRFLRWMIRNLLSISVTDTQCGLKGFRSEVRDIWLNGKVNRYLFDLEAIYNAEHAGIKLVTIPVKLREGVVFSAIRRSLIMKELKNFFSIVLKSRRSKFRRGD